MRSPELEQDVSANRNTNQRDAAYLRILHHAEQISSLLGHRRRPVANLGFSVAAQVGKDQAMAGREFLGHRHPEFVIRWKGMKQDHIGAIAQNPIGNFSVTASEAMGGHR